MNMNYQVVLDEIYEEVLRGENKGNVAAYIPELAKVDADLLGVHLYDIDKRGYGIGHFKHQFSIQSIAKVFSLCLAYKLMGEKLWYRVGIEPSGTPFNSLVQLESDNGIPRNPFINAGALVVCDILMSEMKRPFQELLFFIRSLADNQQIAYSTRVASSEKMVGYRNIALCNFIKSFDNIKNKPADVLDFYFKLCAIEMDCESLSKTFWILANGGISIAGERWLSTSQSKRINAVMQTCGFYDESGEFSFRVGLPGKSGVGGGIAAIHPKQYSICVWSPRLNKKFNSYRGMKLLEMFTTKTELSIF